jgi:hypothetical protein
MKTNFLLLAILVVLGGGLRAEAPGPQMSRTQSIDLVKGWNAVFLEVEPLSDAPSKVFEGLPVDMVATFIPGSTTEQFITNPGVNLAKSKGWGMWFAKERPEAFLTSLGAIYGQQAYLVHAKSAARWNLVGTVTPAKIRWRSDAYNLVGFGVRAQGAPTFGEFFEASAAHRAQPIYRLVNDAWKKVPQPATETMRSGEAFWIYCDKASDYQGPLGMELTHRQGLMLASGGTSITLRNPTAHPLTPAVERVITAGNDLPLSIVITAFGDPVNPVKSVAVEKPAGAWTQELPALEAGKSMALPFEARLGEMTAPVQGTLLKITTDMGTETWVPVYGVRTDLTK